MADDHETEAKAANRDLMAHLYRKARFRLKQANRTMGKQGETIHQLRAEMAELREIHSKIERGDIRRLEREVADLKADLAVMSAENEKLHAERREQAEASAT